MESLLLKYIIKEEITNAPFLLCRFDKSCFGPASEQAYRELSVRLLFQAGDESVFDCVNVFIKAIQSDVKDFITCGHLDKALKALTVALSAIQNYSVPYFALWGEEKAQLYLTRSIINARKNERAKAVSNAALSVNIDPSSTEAHFQLSQSLADFGQSVDSVRVLYYVLDNYVILNNLRSGQAEFFVRVVIRLAIRVANLKEEEIHLRSVPAALFWLRDTTVWQQIVEKLAEREEYNALGVVTIGTCDNMRTSQTPNIVIFNGANIPGVTYRFIDIGRMLKSLCAKDVHQWHLQMAEFMIKRGADVSTISRAFKQPLLVIMASLCMSADTPMFLHLGFPQVSVLDLDEQDEDGNTPFHVLVKQSNKHHSKTMDILCRDLLSQGCLTSLSDNQGKMACDYVPKSVKLHETLSQSIAWPSLNKRAEKIRELAKKERKIGNSMKAIKIYEKGLSICQNIMGMNEETLKLLTNLSIVNDDQGNFRQSLKYAMDSIRIDGNYWKGHFWVATSYSKLGETLKASDHFFVCFNTTDISQLKTSVLLKILELFPKLIDTPVINPWLHIVKRSDVWPVVLEKMTNLKMWMTLKALILGPPYNDEGQGVCWEDPAFTAHLQSIFEVVQDSNVHAARLILALLQHGADIKTIASNPDEVLHEVVRFCVLTNDTAVLKHTLGKMKKDGLRHFQNAEGKTPLHKLSCLVGEGVKMETKVKLAKMLCESGVDPSVKDVDGKTAADYAPDKSALMDHLKGNKVETCDVKKEMSWQHLKEQGTEMYNAKNYGQAIRFYSEALDKSSTASKHDRAVLYSNRSECFLKQNQVERALEDAQRCVDLDAQWFRGHLRVAKSLCRLGHFEHGFEAFRNSFEKAEDTRYKVQVLLDQIDGFIDEGHNKDQIAIFMALAYPYPDALLELALRCVKEQKWFHAEIASSILELPTGRPSERHTTDFKIFCNPDMLKINRNWILRLLVHTMLTNDDLTSLKFHDGDTYFHALVHICLLIEGNAEIYFQQIIQKFVREKNVCDNKGNTVLHLIAEYKDHYKGRVVLAYKLLEFGVEVMAVNKCGKLALDLCGPTDDLRRMFQHFIETENEINKRKKTTSGRSSSRGPRHPERDRSSSVNMRRRSKPRNHNEVFEPQNREASATRTKATASANSSNPKPDKKLQHKPEIKKPCDECEELMREALECKKEEKDLKVFLNLSLVVNKKHGSDPRHNDLKNICLERLDANLAVRREQDIPPSLLQINASGCLDLINLISRRGRWKQIYHLVNDFKVKKGWNSLKSFGRQISLMEFLTASSLTGQEDERLKILNLLLDNGASLEDVNSADLIKCAMINNEFKVVLKLLEKGADPAGITLTPGDTPLHAALLVALEKDAGNFNLFHKLTSEDSSGNKIYKNLDLKCQDDKGNNLLHLAAKVDYTIHAKKAVARLCKNQVPVNQRNKNRQLPIDCLTSVNDLRATLLQDVAVNSVASHSTISEASMGARPKIPSAPSASKVIHSLREDMNKTLRNLHDSDFDIFAPPPPEEDEETDEENSSDDDSDNDYAAEDGNISDDSQRLSEDENDESEEMNIQSDVDVKEFDNQPWEVECTEEVWNILKVKKERKSLDLPGASSTKVLRKERVTDSLKKIVIKKIQDLASGQWHTSLTKRIKNIPSSLQLHYIKLYQGCFILWELAVAFSPKCSQKFDENDVSVRDPKAEIRNGRIYSEVIRVWSIVLNHSSLKPTIERIVKSHQSGKNCIVKKNLKCISSVHFSRTTTSVRIPMRYEETEITMSSNTEGVSNNTTSLCPPASTGKAEFHILKFYSFTSTLVATILNNVTAKVEFPFKVTDKEHQLINLQTKAPLLLIGRSGTGKTTVCLYRLWTKYLGYWEQVGIAGPQILPRSLPPLEVEDHGQNIETKEEDNEEYHNEQMQKKNKSGPASGKDDFNESDDDTDEEDDDVSEDDDENDSSNDEGEDEEDEEEEKGEIQTNAGCERVEYHHLHQIFVTKNPKLCTEVKKSFCRLCQATDYTFFQARGKESLPNTLQELSEEVFPLFLTSRQLLIMLDASVHGIPFFERDENLALKSVIPGWGTQKEIFHDIPLEVDSSDDDDEGRGGAAAASVNALSHRNVSRYGRQRSGARSKHKQNRRECTYEVFAHEVWPAIKKKEIQCHPSLVWTEIMSFIKGSYEALHTEKGYLDENQYIEIGRKRAPNFSGDRSEVYRIFEGYAIHRSKHFLFDEADFVFNIYKRLKKMDYQPWVFHQIYVDEIQDFTQGELCLLINLCEHPNEMLLTGDTAQTIMRGISFRFEDLKSLFYYAQKSSGRSNKGRNSIKLPKGYEQLKHNYRSHTGILSLASAVLNLLAEFFKDSFDVLEPDQGMFAGPFPVVIETCSPGNLAFLLSGNRRKTSHIEFGAHQAILVVSEEAKNNLPQELRSGIILTIYESKGLEFDDILIYNFFKDSKATEEWRVVTSYLNNLMTKPEGEKVTSYGSLSLDQDVLSQTGRPHPLTFDANKHKVLNAELKHLYTAITRARVNVWLFDEDLNKRAPIFEYFKALNLVRCMRPDEALDSDTFFAEESTPREWRKKGDLFMNQKLYMQAAMCYEKAGSFEKQRLAQAFHAAREASQMKEIENVSSRDVKLAYFKAGAQFVYCGNLNPAAVCFLNAKEIALAALAFEKNGEFEEAGQRYQISMEFIKASICFKKCGMYHQAVKALVDGKKYEEAIVCLSEYKALMKKLEKQHRDIPAVLTDNRPNDSVSETNLLFKLIEEHAKNKDKRLKQTIQRLPNTDEQIRCMRKYKLFVDAANLMKNQGNFEDAVNLLIEEDLLDDALEYAEKSLLKPIRASVHLAIACRDYTHLMNSEEEEGDSQVTDKGRLGLIKDGLRHSNSAKALYNELPKDQGMAQATLLVGMLKKDLETLKTATRAFENSSPTNHVGVVETFKEFMTTKKTALLDECETKMALHVMEIAKLIIDTLNKPSATNANMELSYLMSFELRQIHQKESIIWCPNQVPLSILTRRRFTHKKFRHAREKSEAIVTLCSSLETDVETWTERVEISLDEKLSKKLQCIDFKLGTNCEKAGCSYLHLPGRSQKEIESVTDVLCQKVTLEKSVQDFVERRGGQRDEYDSTKALLDFLPPFGQRLNLLPFEGIKYVIHKIRTTASVRQQLCRYFLFMWNNAGRVGRGKSNNLYKERAKESDWLIQACFYAKLLDLKLDVEREAIKMEVYLRSSDKDWLSKRYKYAIFTVVNEDGHIGAVESLGRRFIKSFKLLTGEKDKPPDLFESLFPFTKLLGAFGKRGNTSLMPAIEHLLFWMEFYSTLTFCFLAEIYQRDVKKPRHFFIPASYKQVMDLVNICKGNSTIEGEIVSHKFEQRFPAKMLFQRQQFIINLLTGCEQYSKICLIKTCVNFCQDDWKDVLVAERVLVLSLVLLLNMTLQYADHELTDQIRRAFQGLIYSKQVRERLGNLIHTAKNACSAIDVVEGLNNFLQSRQEDSLSVATWNNRNSAPLIITDLNLPEPVRKTLSIPFPEFTMEDDFVEETPEFGDDGEVEMPDEEELEKESETRNQMIHQEQQRTEAAKVIIRWIRMRRMHKILKNRSYRVYEKELQFESFVLSDTFCGICGCNVGQALEETSMFTEVNESATKDQHLTAGQKHAKSSEHVEKRNAFMDFKDSYISLIHDASNTIERFILKHQVLEHPEIHADFNVYSLIDKFNAFKNIKDKVIAERWWTFAVVLASFNQLQNAFFSTYKAIEIHFKVYQEQQKQEREHNHLMKDGLTISSQELNTLDYLESAEQFKNKNSRQKSSRKNYRKKYRDTK